MTRKMTAWVAQHFIFLCNCHKPTKYLSKIKLHKETSYLYATYNGLMVLLYLDHSWSSSFHWPVPGIHLLLEMRIRRVSDRFIELDFIEQVQLNLIQVHSLVR